MAEQQNRTELKQKLKREEGQSQISRLSALTKLRSSCSVGTDEVFTLGVVTSRGEGVHSPGINSGFTQITSDGLKILF